MPAIFLFSHCLELCFKAYLRANDVATRDVRKAGHNLRELLALCKKHGFQVAGVREVVEELQVENDVHGFRYLSPKASVSPGASVLEPVVDAVLIAVAKPVEELRQKTYATALRGKAFTIKRT
jgi:hypothetical protein